MKIGTHLLSWRSYRNLTQKELAEKASILRPYLSRLERNEVDPSLSLLRRLAGALGLTAGKLIDELPPHNELSRKELDLLSRQALEPDAAGLKTDPMIRSLSRALRGKRQALGFFRPRKKSKPIKKINRRGQFALRRLRIKLGEKQWNALLSRIDKYSTLSVRMKDKN